ncbi:PTS-dependent dihydroxyacetone kinase phosphotransferase subunit DhaM [Caloramator sp. E03]|uniref:dihydroxyacetone kinase phosphoryl donor subunit DhaM n=1 Tax=Caloramator sp. E03 TaxID=2576307 RepID=UPI001110303E|nr:dihydroxyacetone kinase phosphoryl donor subunit DhaM [Caloramator sp. E03]QCX34680.1 PTS-dependent dihydroxyacetone kinase phosphotransferase subunit DhaM [Caloramator sp. E03]
MVGIVVVSHSEKIATGVKELASQMAPNVKIECAGGTFDGRIGTDCNKIIESIEKVYSDDGVLIVYDLGSALMNSEMALEFLDGYNKEKIKIAICALVEGTVAAAVEASLGKELNKILNSISSLNINKG